MSKASRRLFKGVGLLVLGLYLLPKLTLFYLVCGVYDISRNSKVDLPLVSRYFCGNGALTWLLSPVNVLLDVMSLPFVNKGVYRLQDLPGDYQREIVRLIEATRREDLVGKLQAVAANQKRSMFFFKWYGGNVKTVVDIPAFHEHYRYVKTIGVSVFNKKASTSAHSGPMRAMFRVLYNINDMTDESAYITVGAVDHFWKREKLFIFDDTLLHQSFNESDQVRYCLFVDIVRPSRIPAVLSMAVSCVARLMSAGGSAVFYGNWKVFKA